MRVGVLGSGDVGQALGLGFARIGDEVRMGTRDTGAEKVRAWRDHAGERASVGSFAEAAEFAEVAVLATNWAGTENALRLADPSNLEGKVVIDVTNPLDYSAGPPPTLAVGHDDSGGEQVQRWVPTGRVVKAFNTVGHDHMVDPDFPDGPPDMFICGNDEAAKEAVSGICRAFGWPTIDLGGIEASRYLEPLAMIWIYHGMRTESWDHAFRLLRK